MRLYKGKIFFRSKCKFLRFARIFIVTVNIYLQSSCLVQINVSGCVELFAPGEDVAHSMKRFTGL